MNNRHQRDKEWIPAESICSTKDKNRAMRDGIDFSADMGQVRKLSVWTSLSWSRRMESIASECSHSKWLPKCPNCWRTESSIILNSDQFQCTPMIFPFFCQVNSGTIINSKNLIIPGQRLKRSFWKKMNMQIKMIIRVQRAHCLTDNLFVVLKYRKGFRYAPYFVPYVILFCLHQNSCCCPSFRTNLFFF